MYAWAKIMVHVSGHVVLPTDLNDREVLSMYKFRCSQLNFLLNNNEESKIDNLVKKKEIWDKELKRLQDKIKETKIPLYNVSENIIRQRDFDKAVYDLYRTRVIDDMLCHLPCKDQLTDAILYYDFKADANGFKRFVEEFSEFPEVLNHVRRHSLV